MKHISGKRMCRLLEDRGWELDRVTGSHHVFYHPDTGTRTIVPVHSNKELKQGTQRRIMRDAGLKDDDL
jgi:predicted RNA binding protein YcfA (HicA-like mRNA interferase family)